MGLLLLKGNTLYGLEVLSWLLSQLSNKCGFPNKNMMNLAHLLSTGSASKAAKPILPTAAIFFISGLHHPQGVSWSPEPPRNNIFPLRTVFYLITNHSKQTCIFGYPLYAFTFFFSQNFLSAPNQHPRKLAHPPSFQNFKMKKHPLLLSFSSVK